MALFFCFFLRLTSTSRDIHVTLSLLAAFTDLTPQNFKALFTPLEAFRHEPYIPALTVHILKYAKAYGWRRFHVRGNTRRLIQGDVGFPDLVLLRPPRLLFAELKVGHNQPSKQQQEWLDALARLPYTHVECYTWRLEDWELILRLLEK